MSVVALMRGCYTQEDAICGVSCPEGLFSTRILLKIAESPSVESEAILHDSCVDSTLQEDSE